MDRVGHRNWLDMDVAHLIEVMVQIEPSKVYLKRGIRISYKGDL